SQEAPYFSEYIRQELEPKYGTNALFRGGLQIYTTLDLNLQHAAEQILEENAQKFDKAHPNPKPPQRPGSKVVVSTETPKVQGALLSLDVKTGEVRAMIGGRDFKTSQFNRATQAV